MSKKRAQEILTPTDDVLATVADKLGRSIHEVSDTVGFEYALVVVDPKTNQALTFSNMDDDARARFQ